VLVIVAVGVSHGVSAHDGVNGRFRGFVSDLLLWGHHQSI
jgi:hypothetical protein